MRGEKCFPSQSVRYMLGSPPLARGKVRKLGLAIVYDGITPACAGKSPDSCSEAHRQQDHPRLCGEKRYAVWENVPGAGSPPLARGKGSSDDHFWVRVGITPACAGKRHFRQPDLNAIQDHPRLRGEKVTGKNLLNPALGSPPLARGKGKRARRGLPQ